MFSGAERLTRIRVMENTHSFRTVGMIEIPCSKWYCKKKIKPNEITREWKYSTT